MMHQSYRKITEIPWTYYRTKEQRDASGKLVRERVPFSAPRKLNLVSGWPRFAHYLIDAVILYCCRLCLQAIVPFIAQFDQSSTFSFTIGSASVALFTFLSLFLTVGYYTAFEYGLGITPGKLVTGCRVIDAYANKPGFGNILGRSFIRLVPFEAFSCLNDRGWHDRWSETYLVKNEEAELLQKLIRESDEAELIRLSNEFNQKKTK
jgi:uncharacterized RDD family membrane protein YckC